MKKHIFFALAGFFALLASGCGSAPAGPAGSISGTLQNAAGQTVELRQRTGSGMQTVGSAQVGEDGSFSLVPDTKLGGDFYFLVAGDNPSIKLITDSTETLSLQVDAANPTNNPQVQGSANTRQLWDLIAQMQPARDRMEAELARTKDPQLSADERIEAKKAATDARNELQNVAGSFIRNNPNSPAALEALTGLSFQRSMKSFEAVLKGLKGNFSDAGMYQSIAGQVENIKKQMALQGNAGNTPGVGQLAPDIAMADLDGNTRKLSDLRGKVVLIDFWASWCGPCRRENPNVVKAYAEYKDKGFEVFSVSLDKTPDRWAAAIEQDGLVWDNHVSDLQGWKNAAAKLYDVHSIPATFLIDQEGKVVASNLRGPALDNKLEELLGS